MSSTEGGESTQTGVPGVAERRGVAVSFAVSGEAVPVPAAVRRELAEPVLAALTGARTRARVSLLRGAGEVRLAVLGDFPVTTGSGTPSSAVEVDSAAHGDRTRTEARWRTTS